MASRLLLLTGGLLALVALSLTAPAPAIAGEVVVAGTQGEFAMHVTSMRERRFKNVVLQHYDFSCGAAAVATILTYDYKRPTPESEPFIKMIQHGERAQIEKVGFSLLDMKHYLESIGLHPVGISSSLDGVAELGVPGIVLIEKNGYKHFVVLRAVDDRRVLLADPALGMQVVPRDTFESMWDGIMLLIRDNPDVGRSNFNEQAFWAVRPPAPIGSAFGIEGMSTYSSNLYLHNLLLIAF